MTVYENYLAAAANGPCVKLSGLCEHFSLKATLVAKLEFGGPTSNMRDRVAAGMLQLAAQRGQLPPECVITEAASGPFALSFALQASILGHTPVVYCPGPLPHQAHAQLAAVGAQVVYTGTADGWTGAMEQAQCAAKKHGGYFLDHTRCDDNPEVHRRTTGPEIYRALDGQLDILIASVGSGGAITGTAEYLKGWAGNIQAIAVQPAESPVLTGGFAGPHGITGMGLPFVPQNYNPYVVDDVLAVRTGDAADMMDLVLRTDGIPATISGAAALAAAVEVAARPENRGRRIVALVDGKRVF